MIPLQKGPTPQVLQQNEAAWAAEYLAVLNSGCEIPDSVRFRYRHPDIKSALKAEANNKCVYCESIIATGEIDHINPVSHCPDQIVKWHNLALCCKECNFKKRDYYAPNEPLINPFLDNPHEHLWFFGMLLMERNSSDLGFRTKVKLDLNRPHLILNRAKRIEGIQHLVIRWKIEKQPQTKLLLEQAIKDEAAPPAEYSAVVKEYLAQELGWAI